MFCRGKAQGLDGLERQLAVQAKRPLDGHLPVAEGGVGEDLRLGRFLELKEGPADALDVVGRQLAVLLAQVLARRLEPLAGIAVEERRAVVHLGDAAAQRRAVVHLRRHVDQEEHLAIAGAGDRKSVV